jgi:integrase
VAFPVSQFVKIIRVGLYPIKRPPPCLGDSFNWLVKRAGKKAGLPFQAHAHMLRHSAGYKLAADNHDTRSIQAYPGHADIRHTVRYTASLRLVEDVVVAGLPMN